MIARLRDRQEWALAGALRRASPLYAAAWWAGVLLRGALPALIAVASGSLIGAITDGDSLTAPLVGMAVVFIAAQVAGPLHEAVGMNLGDRVSTMLNDELMRATLGPAGIAHLERTDLADDLTTARDFDLGITGPPMSFNADVHRRRAGGHGRRRSPRPSCWRSTAGGRPSCWCSPGCATHWLLRESAVWRDRNTPAVQRAQRHAEYSYRLAVDPPAAKEVRLFGLADWVIDRFMRQRRQLYDLQYEATRLRERPVRGCAWHRRRRQRRRVLDAGRSRRRRPARPGRRGRRPAGGDRRQRHRLRRAQLGARRRRRAGRRRWPGWSRRWPPPGRLAAPSGRPPTPPPTGYRSGDPVSTT